MDVTSTGVVSESEAQPVPVEQNLPVTRTLPKAHDLATAIIIKKAPAPEPEIYAMMGPGLGLMGWVGRRKRQTQG